MNKKEIQKIIAFLKEVNALPDEILSSEDGKVFSDNRSSVEQQEIYDKQAKLFDKFQDIKIRLLAYFRAIAGENSSYITLLNDITFKPKLFTYNSLHFKNNEAWFDDKKKLVNLLKMAKSEFEEKTRIANESPENSIRHYLKSREAKGIILAALLALITGIATKDIWWDKVFTKSDTSKSNSIQVDSLISIDKVRVIERAAQEIFTNYYQKIKYFRTSYAAVSAEDYIKEYRDNEFIKIDQRISNRSYILRFAIHQKLWTNSDYLEVANIIRARTINRIKEISEDIWGSSNDPFTITDNRLQALEEKVKSEIKN